jgi:hypothetical protein
VQITERRFDNAGLQRAAFLRQRYFIIVRKQDKEYGAEGSRGMPSKGAVFAFDQVRITTLVTPNLSAPGEFLPPHGQDIFVPMIGGKPFLFHMIGTDWATIEAEFTSPVVFVVKDLARNASVMQALTAKYNDKKKTPAEQKRHCAPILAREQMGMTYDAAHGRIRRLDLQRASPTPIGCSSYLRGDRGGAALPAARLVGLARTARRSSYLPGSLQPAVLEGIRA